MNKGVNHLGDGRLVAFLIVILILFASAGMILAANFNNGAEPVPNPAISDVVKSSPIRDPLPRDTAIPLDSNLDEMPAPSPFPADYASYSPLPLPEHQEIKSNLPENKFALYNALTGEQTIAEVAFTSDEITMVVASNEDGGAKEESRDPLNFSALSLVTDPENSPYSRTVKMFFSRNGLNYVCSGALIDPLHVITTGHCLNEGNGGEWSSDVFVVPAYENGIFPYGYAAGVLLVAWEGWTVDGDFDHDVGIIGLDRPIGALTGWHGYGFNNDCDHFTGGTWQHDGYPAEPPYDGQYMYEQSGDFDECESDLGVWYGNEVAFLSRTYGGQSGSGAYRGEVVYALLSNGTITKTWDVRITATKFGQIRDEIISENTPSSFDLIPLAVTSAPTTMVAGEQLASLSFIVHNYASTTYNGNVDFTVYLSADSEITAADIPLGSATFSWNFGPKDSVQVDVTDPPIIPAATAAGDYYIGVILDITDANTGNNASSYQDASPISIEAVPVPAVPANVQASDGTYTDKVNVTWDSVSGATYYEIYRATSVTGDKSMMDSVTGTSYDDFSAEVGVTYIYWVEACNTSGCSEYSTEDSGYRGEPPGGCSEGIVNGSFEEQTAWTMPVTPYKAAYSTDQAHSGSWAARTGIIDPLDNVYSYSSAYQTVTIPSDAKYVTLRFWLYPQTTEPTYLSLPRNPLGMRETEAASSGDAQLVLLLNKYGQEIDRLLVMRSNAADWLYYSFDISRWKGQTIKVYFDSYNNGWAGVTSMFVDDVSLEVCTTTPPTSTTTLTPTNTTTATPTNTPTATATATSTSTPTNTPENTPTSTATNTPTPTVIYTFYGPTLFGDVPVGISGQVKNWLGAPLPYADVKLSNGQTTLTDLNGYYNFPSLPPDSYTISVELAGYQFDPQQRLVALPPSAGNQDFTAVEPTATPDPYP